MPGRRRKMPFMNRLSMDEQQSIIGLLRLGWKQRRIARETGFHRATIRRIAREAAIEPAKCTTPAKVATDPKPATGLEVPTGSRRSRSVCEPHRSFIEAE